MKTACDHRLAHVNCTMIGWKGALILLAAYGKNSLLSVVGTEWERERQSGLTQYETKHNLNSRHVDASCRSSPDVSILPVHRLFRQGRQKRRHKGSLLPPPHSLKPHNHTQPHPNLEGSSASLSGRAGSREGVFIWLTKHPQATSLTMHNNCPYCLFSTLTL